MAECVECEEEYPDKRLELGYEEPDWDREFGFEGEEDGKDA
jgi:hypothetical protein